MRIAQWITPAAILALLSNVAVATDEQFSEREEIVTFEFLLNPEANSVASSAINNDGEAKKAEKDDDDDDEKAEKKSKAKKAEKDDDDDDEKAEKKSKD